MKFILAFVPTSPLDFAFEVGALAIIAMKVVAPLVHAAAAIV